MRPLLLLLSLCLLAACRKDGIYNTAKMLRGDWRMTEKYIDDGIDSTFKGNRVQPGSCLEDDVTTFERNGNYSLNAGEEICEESADKQCKWSLADDRTILFTGMDSTTSHITELTGNTLTLTETRTYGTKTLKGTFVYQRIK